MRNVGVNTSSSVLSTGWVSRIFTLEGAHVSRELQVQVECVQHSSRIILRAYRPIDKLFPNFNCTLRHAFVGEYFSTTAEMAQAPKFFPAHYMRNHGQLFII